MRFRVVGRETQCLVEARLRVLHPPGLHVLQRQPIVRGRILRVVANLQLGARDIGRERRCDSSPA